MRVTLLAPATTAIRPEQAAIAITGAAPRQEPTEGTPASKAQLRTSQRRVKAWRAERAKEMVLGRLRVPDAMPIEV